VASALARSTSSTTKEDESSAFVLIFRGSHDKRRRDDPTGNPIAQILLALPLGSGEASSYVTIAAVFGPA
jgi:hypothetical protein